MYGVVPITLIFAMVVSVTTGVVAYADFDNPKKQLAYLQPFEIICHKDLVLLLNNASGDPACVNPATKTALIERGWGAEPELVLNLTEEELQWIAQNPSIHVAYDPEWPPIEFRDEHGNMMGIGAQYEFIFERDLGIDIVQINVPSWSDALLAVQEGDAQILMLLGHTPDRGVYLDFTEPHSVLPWSMVTLTEQTVGEDDDLTEMMTFATITDYEIEKWLDQNRPSVKYVSYKDHAMAFAALKAGEVDALIQVWPVAKYTAKSLGFDTVYDAGSIGHDVSLSIGTAKSIPMLGTIIDKALDRIPVQIREQILDTTIRD